jgi:MoaA/NifB/PqqE/SkfB family radical SAM enzyme
MRVTTLISIFYINLKLFFLKIFNSKKIIPYKVLINLTDLCNSRCNFCDIWKIKPENEINVDNIIKSFDGSEKDIYWISLSGGEVTLVKYYFELIDRLKKKLPNLKIIAFTTNCLTPNRVVKYAKYIKDNDLDPLITLSLDGDEKLHDEVRGVKGNYKKCLETYEMLKNEKILCHYGITLSNKNYEFVKNDYHNYKDTMKAVTFIHSEGIYNKENSYEDDEKIIKSLKIIDKNFKVNKLYEIIEKIHIKLSIKFLEQKREKNIIPCDVLNSSIHIMQDGAVKPCMFMKEIGNIKENNMLSFLKKDSTLEIKKKIKKDQCPKCWMNCYSPHSIIQSPIKSFFQAFL